MALPESTPGSNLQDVIESAEGETIFGLTASQLDPITPEEIAVYAAAAVLLRSSSQLIIDLGREAGPLDLDKFFQEASSEQPIV